MTKIFLILFMLGTHADTGKNVSKAEIFKTYSSQEECIVDKKILLAEMEDKLIKSGWIAARGKVKVEYFNAVCSKYTEAVV